MIDKKERRQAVGIAAQVVFNVNVDMRSQVTGRLDVATRRDVGQRLSQLMLDQGRRSAGKQHRLATILRGTPLSGNKVVVGLNSCINRQT